MRTTSKKKSVRRKVRETRAPKPDSPQVTENKTPKFLAAALDEACSQWLTEYKDRTITSLEELVLVSSLTMLSSTKRWKVAAQVLLLALKVAEQDPSVAETLRGLFIKYSAAEDEMEFRAKQAKESIQLDSMELKEGDRVLIKNQKRPKRNGVYKARVKKGPRK